MPLPLASRKLSFQVGDDAVEQLRGAPEIAAALRHLDLAARLVQPLLQLLALVDRLLLRLPGGGHRVRFFFKLGEFPFQPRQPVLRGRVGFLFQRLALDLELDHPPVELVERLRLAVHLHPQPARRLVHEVDRLVGQEAVGDVAVRERRRGDDRAVGDAHAVVKLVLLLDAAENADRVGDRRLADEHRLEAPGERRVLLDVLAVLVERGRADAVQRAAGEFGLDQVRGVHRAVGAAGADQGVHLVDEQDDLALCRLDLLQHGLQALLELAAVFRAGDHGAKVERKQALTLDRLRHVAVDDADGKSFDDRGLADAGFADQHRVVLRAPRQHLDGAADFFLAPDHRVELAFAGKRGDVAGVFLQCIEVGLGVGAVDLAALADFGHRPFERLRRRAGGAQGAGGRRVRGRDGDQQPVLRDETVAGLRRRLLRGIEDADEFGRELRLAGAGALHLRHLGKVGLDGAQRRLRVATGGADQAGRGAFLIIEQRLEQMLGRDPLVEFADRNGGSGLQEALRALGELFDVHRSGPSAQATSRTRP